MQQHLVWGLLMFLFIVGLILFFLVPLVLIFALIKPAKLRIRTKNNVSGRWSWKQFFSLLAVLFVASLVCLVVGATSDSATEFAKVSKQANSTKSVVVTDVSSEPAEEIVALAEESEAVVSEPAQVAKEIAKVPVAEVSTLGITLNQFGTNFMANATELGLGDYSWDSNPKLTKGKINDSFTLMLSDAIAMNGIVAKNGELKSITYILGKTDEGDNAANAAMSMLIMGGITAKSLNPDLPQKQTSEVIGELVTSAAKEFEKTGSATESKIVGSVKYTVIASKTIGLWLSFEPA